MPPTISWTHSASVTRQAVPPRGKSRNEVKRAVATLTAAAIVGGVLVSRSEHSSPEKPARTVTISWDYPDLRDIVFNVWACTNLAAPRWELIATVTEQSITIPADLPAQFFTVSASNTLTGQESPSPASR